MARIKPDQLQQRLNALETIPIEDLRGLWHKYYGTPAPAHYQRSYLVRRVGYHLQALAYGGLSKTAREKLKRLASQPALKSIPTYTISPGTRIVKEWRGKQIVVHVQDQRTFLFNDKPYKSLSAIASELVGCKQSGIRFFGLHRKVAP